MYFPKLPTLSLSLNVFANLRTFTLSLNVLSQLTTFPLSLNVSAKSRTLPLSLNVLSLLTMLPLSLNVPSTSRGKDSQHLHCSKEDVQCLLGLIIFVMFCPWGPDVLNRLFPNTLCVPFVYNELELSNPWMHCINNISCIMCITGTLLLQVA